METDNDKKYAITPVGILFLGTGSMEVALALWDCLKEHARFTGNNAIMLDGKGGAFIKLEHEYHHSIGLAPRVEDSESNA